MSDSHRLAGRRDALRLLGAGGVGALFGCGSTSGVREDGNVPGMGGDGAGGDGAGGDGAGGDGAGGRASGGVANGTGGAGGAAAGAGGGGTTSCVIRPEHTEGPYFVDERLHRADIRTDPTNGMVSAGAELRLEIGVFRREGAACAAVPGALVDLWQCDAEGVYAGVVDTAGQFDTTGRKFLRGYQITDAEGSVRFVTIYPGWYTGRTVHLHFKVRLFPDASAGLDYASQLYFPDAVTDEVAALAPYASRGARTVRNERDSIYVAGGSSLLLDVRRDGSAYAARIDLALPVA